MKATTLQSTSTLALLRLILAACALLFGRAYLCTVHGLKTVGMWLKNRHNFTDQDDPVYMRGYQFILLGLAYLFVCLLLSIQY